MMQCLKPVIGVALFFLSGTAHSQSEENLADTLPLVMIKAFESNRKLKDVPASVGYVNKTTLGIFNNNSIVAAMNTVPGVRMEERSPGSYRLNIRGSSLRSPFGVRNVKIYLNDLVFTDPGGHSYLNQLGFYDFNSIEIIKGANNSVYGAGTGGVMLIESLGENEKPNLSAQYTAGSFGLQNMYAALSVGAADKINRFAFQHQESDGYREHSALRKNVYSWNGLYKFEEGRVLKTSFLYGEHFYQTPGALTKAEWEADPKAARPGNAFFPGALAANASIRQKMFLAGASFTQPISKHFSNKTSLGGMFTQLQNPSIASYGKSAEPNVNGRTTFIFDKALDGVNLSVNAGMEYQQGFTSVSIYKNNSGNPDSLRNTDEINNQQQLFFTQASLETKGWSVIAGASLGKLRVLFERFSPQSSGKQKRVFNNQIAPRLSVMKKLTGFNIYGSIAKGYSPPTTAELLPTGGAINLDLSAEEGTNYELGIKATRIKNLYIDANVFFYRLSNTIVQRRNAAGTDFFVNAGSTKQKGLEWYSSYQLFNSSKLFKRSQLWLSYTLYDFHYDEFKQVSADYSGNKLPSVAPNTLSAGIDMKMQNGFQYNINYFLSDEIALNDANTEYADAFHVLGLQLGYERMFKNKLSATIRAGAENIFDVKYSLGNDINGFNGRYYNAAAGRNFYVGLELKNFL